MTTTPISNPTWATDATVASGTEVGLPTKVVPSDGVRQQGVKADEGFAARLFNSILNTVGEWILYLREANGLRLNDTARVVYPMLSTISASNYLPSDAAWRLQGPEDNFGSGTNNLQTVVYQAKTNVLFFLPLDVPPDSVITRVDISLKGDDTHVSALPDTTMPAINLIAISDDGTVDVLDGGVIDTSADVAAYKTVHTLAIEPVGGLDAGTGGGLSRRRLFLHVQGEARSDLGAALLIFCPRVYIRAKTWA